MWSSSEWVRERFKMASRRRSHVESSLLDILPILPWMCAFLLLFLVTTVFRRESRVSWMAQTWIFNVITFGGWIYLFRFSSIWIFKRLVSLPDDFAFVSEKKSLAWSLKYEWEKKRGELCKTAELLWVSGEK